MNTDLAPLFEPRSIVVVGASATAGSIGKQSIENLLRAGYSGTVYAVNPRYDQIDGVQCFPSLADLPESVDCALVLVPASAVVDVTRQAAAAGVRSCVVLSSGFKELTDPVPATWEVELAQIAADSGMAVLGPNCLGLVNFGSRAVLTFIRNFTELTNRIAGDEGIAIVSQSGALGTYLIHAQARSVPFTHFISTGNSAVVDVGDCIEFLVTAPGVRAIVVIFEGLRVDSEILDALLRAQSVGIPVVALKTGRADRGIRAARFHTGTEAGDYTQVHADFSARGVRMVDSVPEALDAATFLTKFGAKTPTAPGIAILTASGGGGILACDAAARHAVELADLNSQTQHAISEVVPYYGVVTNPVDVTATAFAGEPMGRALRGLAADDAVGAIVVPIGFSDFGEDAQLRQKEFLHWASMVDKPICVVWMSLWFENAAASAFEVSRNVSLFRDLDSCFATLNHWFGQSIPVGVAS